MRHIDFIFIACVDLKKQYSGISRKVYTEYSVLSQKMTGCLLCYCGEGIKIINGTEEVFIPCHLKYRRVRIMQEAIRISKQKVKYAYIRRLPCNPLVIQMLSSLKKNGIEKIVWEIPTYPYDHEHDDYKFNFLIKLTDRTDIIFRKCLKKYVDRVVTFSSYTDIFGIKTINTGNGINVDEVRPRKVNLNRERIDMIAVAVLSNWHAYDRLIRGIYEYYLQGGNRKVYFHLVGDGSCLPEYKKLAQDLNVEEHIVFYGFKNKEEIDDIYDKCNIAVESLGWHRSKVEMGTSIKTREYLAKGLPIIASTPMDIFPNGCDYAYYAAIDESPININEVISFYDRITSIQTEYELAETLRKVAYEKCDMKITMKPVIDFYLD